MTKLNQPVFRIGKRKKRIHEKPLKPSDYIAKTFRSDTNRPIDVVNRPYLRELLDKHHPSLTLVASRQTGKSTYMALQSLYRIITQPQTPVLYSAPHQDHIKEFMRRKIKRQFLYNEVLRGSLLHGAPTNTLSENVFANASSLILRAIAITPDAARGIPVEHLYFDETQLLPSEHIRIVEECAQAFPDTATFTYGGTPTHTRDPLIRKYKESTMNEWMITCPSCRKENPKLGIDHIDPAKPYLFCIFCGKEMDARQARWVATNPEAKYPGYRICRLMAPDCRWRTPSGQGVLDLYEQNLPLHLFYNEVLGLPFDRGSKPITEEEVYNNCGEHAMLDLGNLSNYDQERHLVAAIDWAFNDEEAGSSYTILALAGINHEQRVEVVFAKRYVGHNYHDPNAVLDDIVQICKTFNIRVIATDRGVGHKENVRLRELIGIDVIEVQYLPHDSPPTYDERRRCIQVGKTHIMDRTMVLLKDKGFLFPRRPDIEPFAEDILNVKTVIDPELRRVRYQKIGVEPDDFLDLCAFLAILIQRHFGKKMFR